MRSSQHRVARVLRIWYFRTCRCWQLLFDYMWCRLNSIHLCWLWELSRQSALQWHQLMPKSFVYFRFLMWSSRHRACLLRTWHISRCGYWRLLSLYMHWPKIHLRWWTDAYSNANSNSVDAKRHWPFMALVYTRFSTCSRSRHRRHSHFLKS